jgi:hypothetical protein
MVGVTFSPDVYRVAVRRALNHVPGSSDPDCVDHIDELTLAVDDEGLALAVPQLERLQPKPGGVEVQ